MTSIHLRPNFFGEKERTLIEHGAFTASLFNFDSGVAALRLKNDVGELVMLPFQGQQIWSANMRGRELTMRSMFAQPRPTREYLANYGAFFLHCGFTAMGGPSPDDTHPLHGELPNAPYPRAHIELGSDARGEFIALRGAYQHTLAFSHNYLAKPLVKLYAGSSVFNVSLRVTNLKNTPMEYMYLAHINFRPVNGSRLIYSAPCTPQTVRVRASIPTHIPIGPNYRAQLDDLARHPEHHHDIAEGVMYDPEAVFAIDYRADADGWAHTLQLLPSGEADYVRHRLDQLPVGIRWLCRTPDQDAMGMIEPATAEVEGYLAEKRKGNVKVLAAHETWQCGIDIGALDASEAAAKSAMIEAMLAGVTT